MILDYICNMNKLNSKYSLPKNFMTSINAVKDVLNLPISTIKNELRKNNYFIGDDSSNCIDKKMLERFAELYKKRLKRYFTLSVENLSHLTSEEYSDFIDFCKTFSKNSSITFNWRQIDKDAIQETFFLEIQEATNTRPKLEISKESLIAFLDAFVCRSVDSLPVFDVKAFPSEVVNKLLNINFLYYDVNKEYLKLESKEKRKFVLYKVKYCRYYRNKLKNKNRYNHHLGKQQRKLFSCLRLHIVPNDGDADGKLIMIA